MAASGAAAIATCLDGDPEPGSRGLVRGAVGTSTVMGFNLVIPTSAMAGIHRQTCRTRSVSPRLCPVSPSHLHLLPSAAHMIRWRQVADARVCIPAFGARFLPSVEMTRVARNDSRWFFAFDLSFRPKGEILRAPAAACPPEQNPEGCGSWPTWGMRWRDRAKPGLPAGPMTTRDVIVWAGPPGTLRRFRCQAQSSVVRRPLLFDAPASRRTREWRPAHVCSYPSPCRCRRSLRGRSRTPAGPSSTPTTGSCSRRIGTP